MYQDDLSDMNSYSNLPKKEEQKKMEQQLHLIYTADELKTHHTHIFITQTVWTH